MIARVCLCVLIGLMALGSCVQAAMPPITLTDSLGPNSIVTIDPYSQNGVFNWTVDGSDQMAQNSYWFRIGSSGAATPISSLGSATIDQMLDFEATVTYSGSLFDFAVTYSLMGSDTGSGTADLAQTAVITNKTGSALDVQLFELVNMDLNGTASGETGTRTNATTITQTEGSTVGMISVNSVPSHWEMADATGILTELSSATFGNLQDAGSPYTGDAGFAFQWTYSIGAHSSISMSQDNLIMGANVPEPSSVIVLFGGIGLLPLLRRRRN